MMDNYDDYIYSVHQTDVEKLPVEVDDNQEQTAPRYLSETFSSRAPDYSVQSEGERLSNTFRAGSHWTLKMLPNRLEPGSIRTERKAHTMTNLLGTGMTNGPDGLGMRAFHNATSSSYFSTHEYITTDYNKNNDLHKALLEEERNLNASFSRKPFKTSSYMRLAPPVPHNFGMKNKDSKAPDSAENDDDGDEEDDIPEHERASLMRTAIKRKIMDLKLGKLVRNEYSAQEKEKILAGHFCNQSGTISAMGDRIQMKKSSSAMKLWSRIIFKDLSDSWPHLRFKIMLQNIVNHNVKSAPSNPSANVDSKSASQEDKQKKKNTAVRPEEGAEELLVQFETDLQCLPPEGALTRYMGHLATHGAAAEIGLQRRCDRWGVLEKGLIQDEGPIKKPHMVLLRMEEYSVRKIETSQNQIAPDIEGSSYGEVSQMNESSPNSVSVASRAKEEILQARADSPYVRSSSSSGKESILQQISGNVPEPCDNLPVWFEPIREVTAEEEEVKTALRVLLYKAVDISDDFPAFISRAIAKAKVDPQLCVCVSEAPDVAGTGPASARLPHSARSGGIKESARGFINRPIDSSRGINTTAALASLILYNSIKVECETKDIESTPPTDTDDNLSAFNAAKTRTPTYDLNGRAYVPSPVRLDSPAIDLFPQKRDRRSPIKAAKTCFSSQFEDGSSITDLLDSLGRSFGSQLLMSAARQTSGWDACGNPAFSSPPSPMSPGNTEMNREFNIVITVTGKWAAAVVPRVPPKEAELPSINTTPRSRACSRVMSTESSNDIDGILALSPQMSGRPECKDKDKDKDLEDTVSPPATMSLRTLLRQTREFSLNERGRSYLHSHKEKMKHKALASVVANEELQKRDEKKSLFTAQRRRVMLSFTASSTDDSFQICDKLLTCVAKAAGMPAGHLLESLRRRSSFKGGDPGTSTPGYDSPSPLNPMMSTSSSSKKLAHVNNKLSQATRKILAASEEDTEVLEVRPDSMKESNLLTFAFYAPWVKISQLNASKKEAHGIRLKAREYQKEEKRKKILWRRRAEKLLFGASVDRRISDLTLQAGGGLEGMKWLLLYMEQENTAECVDVLSQMPSTARKHPGQGNGHSYGHTHGSSSAQFTGPPSGRQSFSNLNPLSDRNLNSARTVSGIQRAPSFSSATHSPSSLHLTDSTSPSATAMRRESRAGHSEILTRAHSVAHVLGIRGTGDLSRSAGSIDLGNLRGNLAPDSTRRTSDLDARSRAMQHLKEGRDDDTSQAGSRKQLQSGGSDPESPRDSRPSGTPWSPKDIPSSRPFSDQVIRRKNTIH